ENYGPWHNTYMAIYFTLTGLHALHVTGGALVIAFILWPGAKMWHTDPERYTNRIQVSGLFWHFVYLVWIFLFPVLYLLEIWQIILLPSLLQLPHPRRPMLREQRTVTRLAMATAPTMFARKSANT